MPGWVWVILVLFLVAMIALGVFYAFRHGSAALSSVAPEGRRIRKDLAALSDKETQPDRKPLALERPVGQMAQDYEDAHYRLVRHRLQVRNHRDAENWRRWADFNTGREKPVPDSEVPDGNTVRTDRKHHES